MFIYGYLTVLILFIVHIEISVGNVFLRIDSSGKKNININSLINFLLNPLYNNFLWNIKLLDLNFIFISVLYYILYYFIYSLNFENSQPKQPYIT